MIVSAVVAGAAGAGVAAKVAWRRIGGMGRGKKNQSAVETDSAAAITPDATEQQ
jgi:hypothetical protein